MEPTGAGAGDEVAETRTSAVWEAGTSPTPEGRTSSVELLWDLVFVFAVTQITTLLAERPSWGRFGESMLALALVWWAWSAFVWAANAQTTGSRALRAYLLVATVLIFVVGLALPQAFGREAVLFAVAYALVRFLHLGLYVEASRRGSASRSPIFGFGVTVGMGMTRLIRAAALLHGWPRAGVWTAAVGIDYAGPALLTRERLRGLQRVSVTHFAERYGTLVIICLGESVVAVQAPMPGPGRLALRGGVAVYLIGLTAFRLRMFGELGCGRVAAALGLIALFALGASIPAWTVAAGIAALVGGLCLSESLAGGPAAG